MFVVANEEVRSALGEEGTKGAAALASGSRFYITALEGRFRMTTSGQRPSLFASHPGQTGRLRPLTSTPSTRQDDTQLPNQCRRGHAVQNPGFGVGYPSRPRSPSAPSAAWWPGSTPSRTNCRREKKLVAYYINQHVILPSVLVISVRPPFTTLRPLSFIPTCNTRNQLQLLSETAESDHPAASSQVRALWPGLPRTPQHRAFERTPLTPRPSSCVVQ